ncbi:LmbU family transcriptional regulator [Streptomyces sp. ACA25]|uniref:LmbU family transcriptional regulator n=1 Tax=Streptomyces sp. ACA25 TaxID=3022596 RepID=UPI002306F15F|nr:LmbU family transcriptional regulator [Streptomyces sp. ACA25]MDB1086995.1 LmbU family transcriptional regulator [Streptomyces sp. ACA25]
MSRFHAGSAGTGGEPVQRDVVLSFVGNQAQVQKSGMIFPQNLPERSWEQIGASLRELTKSSAWWLADWLIFGETTYGLRRYREAIERTGLDYQTLRNYAWVARRFEHRRRRDSLSFAHHAEVTRLSPPEQDYWLRKAEQQKWSRNELRRTVRASLAEQRATTAVFPGTGDAKHEVADPAGTEATDKRMRKGTTLTIELSAGQLDHYAKVAAAHGLPVDKWVAQVLDAADDRRTAEKHTAK